MHMQYYLFPLLPNIMIKTCLALSTVICMCLGGVVNVVYNSDSTYKPVNPDRGFYTQYEYLASSPSLLSLSDLISLRIDSSQSLIFRYYYLDTYRIDGADISASTLNDLAKDIDTMRQAAVRSIIRFAYTSNPSDTPTEPTKSRILRHISQIASTLANSHASDVVLAIQAGFIGPWGEWHSSTNFPLTGTESSNSSAWNDRRQIIQAWMEGLIIMTNLSVTSTPIQIQVRTPGYKQLLLGTKSPLSNFNYSPSNMNTVIAHHNDCFLASNTDWGTYTNITSDYSYLGSDSTYTIMGGETCNYNPPRSNCTSALTELSKFHWTFLNSGYQSQVLQSWKDGGCYDQVNQFLGYRFLITKSTFYSSKGSSNTNTLVSNDTSDSLLSFTLNLRNVGYAAPIRNRSMHLIFRNLVTGTLCVSTPPISNVTDMSPNWRTFVGNGANHSISGQIRLSDAVMSSGQYEVLLNVEDQVIKNSLPFKTKVANAADYNEDGTGFVKLMHTITVLNKNTNNVKFNSSTWDINCDDPINGNIASSKVLPFLTVPGNKHLNNGNMEEDPKTQGGSAPYWDGYMSGYGIDLNVYRSSGASLRVTDGAAVQTIFLNGLMGSVVLSGYSMAVGNVSSSLGSNYALYVDVAYKSGNNLYGQVATFPGGSMKNTWVLSNKSFVLTEPADSMFLYLLYRNDKNKGNRSVYFDDISVSIQGHEATCPDGYYQDAAQCTWCPPGYACNGSSKAACSGNSYSTGGANSCLVCKGCSHGNCSSVSGLCICNVGWTGPFCDSVVSGQPSTYKPSRVPSKAPLSKRPTKRIPSVRPTKKPLKKPTSRPSKKPSKRPTKKPSKRPTKKPSKLLTKKPSKRPTKKPSTKP